MLKYASIATHSYAFNGTNVPVAHKIHKELKIFDQIIHQIAISVFFFRAAVILEASSGKLVQIAIIVIQMKELGIQKL